MDFDQQKEKDPNKEAEDKQRAAFQGQKKKKRLTH